MVHFDAICIGCALDSIYCLQIFRPEIPVHVTKLCQMKRFQNLENKLCWVLSFFCFPLEAQELVDLPNAYLTLACHSKLFFFVSQVRKQVFHWIHLISSSVYPKAVALTVFSRLFPGYCLLVLALAALPKHSELKQHYTGIKSGQKILTGTSKCAL